MIKACEATEKLMTVDELSDFLSVPKSWIYQRTSEGTIPFQKIGRYCRFWLPDVLAWLETKQP